MSGCGVVRSGCVGRWGSEEWVCREVGQYMRSGCVGRWVST